MDLFLQYMVLLTIISYMIILGQSKEWTQRFLSSSISCPDGQPHPGTFTLQNINELEHVLEQVWICWYTWPSIGQSIPNENYTMKYNWIQTFTNLHREYNHMCHL